MGTIKSLGLKPREEADLEVSLEAKGVSLSLYCLFVALLHTSLLFQAKYFLLNVPFRILSPQEATKSSHSLQQGTKLKFLTTTSADNVPSLSLYAMCPGRCLAVSLSP